MSNKETSDSHKHILNKQTQKMSAHQDSVMSSEAKEPAWAERHCRAIVQGAVQKGGDAGFILGILFKHSAS